jgi:hypothetical protein
MGRPARAAGLVSRACVTVTCPPRSSGGKFNY